MRVPLALGAYAAATRLLAPAAGVLLRQRARRGKEDPARLGERLGRAGVARPEGRLLWVHGVSVGESLSLLSIVERALERRPDLGVLATSGTRAAALVMERRLPTTAIQQYAPIDTPGAVKRFFDHWRPDLGILAESDLWPNLLTGAKTAGVRTALVSAKMSASSHDRWRSVPNAARPLLSGFDLILARDEGEARRLETLGARIGGVLDLKLGAAPLPHDEATTDAFRAAWTGRPVILAASTHPGEDTPVLSAFARARAARPDAVLILAPRHPERGGEIAALAASLGLSTSRRTLDRPAHASSVLIADTVGEMGSWCRLADLAIVCGSFVDGIGGHNPLEAARLDAPVISGRFVAGWPIYTELAALGATRLIGTDDLAEAMAGVWSDALALAAMASRAKAAVSGRDALAAVEIDRVLDLLPQ